MCSSRTMENAKRNAKIGRRGFLGLLGAAAVAGVVAPRATRPARAQPAAKPTVSLTGGEFLIQDLTHTVGPDFPVFPGYDPMRIESFSTIEDDGFNSKTLTFNEHTGTHLDAPLHVAADGESADRYPVERFLAPLAVVDISSRAASDADATLTVDDLLAWEDAHGPLPAGAFVAMHSGWAEKANDPAAFLNADDSDALHFPGFAPEVGEFLLGERDVVGIGTDTLSLDPGNSEDLAIHSTWLPAGRYGIENLAGLGAVAPSGATIVVGAPKHEGATGGTLRALALSPSGSLPDTGGPTPNFGPWRAGV